MLLSFNNLTKFVPLGVSLSETTNVKGCICLAIFNNN